jgi:serine/threonine protein kinase
MGRVWKGTDRRDGSHVAVKVLNAQFSRDPTFRQRFEREAHVATLLKSPYTVQTLAFGREQGSYYLVMEFVEGDSVEKLISKGPLPLDEALEIATDAARAIEAAAAHKLVHRDLKPSNIIVSPDGAAKLVDFGIAGQSNVQDAAGGFIGTVQYAPPEQQRGQVDERTDIYALGATLFHMLAGRPPYTGRTNDEILQQHLHAPFPAPLLALHPEPVVDVVRRCMQKDPEDRYHSAADLAAALDRVRMRIQQVRTQTAPVLADEMRTLVPEPEPMEPPTGDTLVLPAGPATGAGAVSSGTGSETMVHPGSQPGFSPFAPPAAPPPARPPLAPRLPEPVPEEPPRREAATMVAPAPIRPPQPPEKKGGRGLLFGIIGVIALAAIGGAAAFFLLAGGDDAKEADPDASPSPSASASASASATSSRTASPTGSATGSATPDETPTATETATATATATSTPTTVPATPTPTSPPATATAVPPTPTPTTPPQASYSASVGGGCGGLSASVSFSNVPPGTTITGNWSGGSTTIFPSSSSIGGGGTVTFNVNQTVGPGTYFFTATVGGAAVASGSATC